MDPRSSLFWGNEFFSLYKLNKRDVFEINDIIQVRYEDEFNQRLYLYLKDGYKLRQKDKDKMRLPVKSDNLVDDLILILSFFQRKGKKIYLSTKV